MLISMLLTSVSLILAKKTPIPPIERPQLVRNALKNDRPIHYFGLGSNMSRKKIENRGLNGTKIEVLSMEAAVVPNYRLAFNLRGFPPLEPGMGSLEPADADSTRLLSYKDAECHGALVKLSCEDYEKVMRSEGVGNGTDSTGQGYEEIVVQAYPYGGGGINGGGGVEPIPAIALRARPHVRLSFDPCPSARYMAILKEGASELQLTPAYQDFLARIPVQRMARWQREQAVYSILFTMSLSTVLRTRIVSRVQSRLVFSVYAPFAAPAAVRFVSALLTVILLMPSAILGFFLYHLLRLTGRTPPAFVRMMTMFGEPPPSNGTAVVGR